MLNSPTHIDLAACRTIAQDACAFLHDALADDARAVVAAHVDRCADCRVSVARDRRYLDALRRAAQSVYAPASLRARVDAAIRRPLA